MQLSRNTGVPMISLIPKKGPVVPVPRAPHPLVPQAVSRHRGRGPLNALYSAGMQSHHQTVLRRTGLSGTAESLSNA